MLTIPIDDIEERARQARPGLAILTAITFVPFLLGWLGRKTWMGVVFLAYAVLAGWRAAGHDDERERDGQQSRGYA